MGNIRLDVAVHERGLAESREKARAIILAGQILVNGQRSDKPGAKVPEDAEITMTGENLRYVSRGGLKLEGAIEAFGLTFTGKVMLDAGASTGGFTDCALQNGAVRVYAVDVGYGQLDWRLRSDPRVVVIERTNIRYSEPEQFPEMMDIATIDVSFISLSLVLPPIYSLMKQGGEVIALVKPQFEAGREQVGKKGVVKDPLIHQEVLLRAMKQAQEIGFTVKNACYSPVKGPNGNIEYFLYLVNSEPAAPAAIDVKELVERAHTALRG
ncbi:MAG: TlyA family RNA methyltransferase [Candidatus Saccharibacteria bacterium]